MIAMVRIRKVPLDSSVFYREFLPALFRPLFEVREDIVALNGHSVSVLAESIHLRPLVSPPLVPLRFDRGLLDKIDGVTCGLQLEDRRTDSARRRSGCFRRFGLLGKTRLAQRFSGKQIERSPALLRFLSGHLSRNRDREHGGSEKHLSKRHCGKLLKVFVALRSSPGSGAVTPLVPGEGHCLRG